MDILTFINNGMQDPFLDAAVPIIYNLTSIYAIPVFLLIILIISWALKMEKIRNMMLICILAFFFNDVITLFLKVVYVSPRPYVVLSNIRMVVQDHGLNSFPSGHTSISFSVISVVLMKAKEHRLILGILAVIYLIILEFSLLYSGVHYPTDLIGGAIIGIVSAAVAVFFSDRFIGFVDNAVGFFKK